MSYHPTSLGRERKSQNSDIRDRGSLHEVSRKPTDQWLCSFSYRDPVKSFQGLIKIVLPENTSNPHIFSTKDGGTNSFLWDFFFYFHHNIMWNSLFHWSQWHLDFSLKATSSSHRTREHQSTDSRAYMKFYQTGKESQLRQISKTLCESLRPQFRDWPQSSDSRHRIHSLHTSRSCTHEGISSNLIQHEQQIRLRLISVRLWPLTRQRENHY